MLKGWGCKEPHDAQVRSALATFRRPQPDSCDCARLGAFFAQTVPNAVSTTQGVRMCHQLFGMQRHYDIVGDDAGDVEHRRPREFVRMCANVTRIAAFDHLDRGVVLNGDNPHRNVA